MPVANRSPLDRSLAIALLCELVAIPSLSHEEEPACRWLAERMRDFGFDRAFVDEAGNAVGELGPASAARTIVLLGHIDTVPGVIPVGIAETTAGPVLYGRGSVDAKGPLASAVAAAARLGSAWAHEHGVQLVVVGAVEEEAASSKGARFIRDRFDGRHAPVPVACVIGEPSGWQRVTLGYKGRILVEMEASQPMAHTAGPDVGVATVAVDFWNWLAGYAGTFNLSREKAFDQLSPSLRRLHTFTDDQMHDHAVALASVRLPVEFDLATFIRDLGAWAAARTGARPPEIVLPNTEKPPELVVRGATTSIVLRLSALEFAWRGERTTDLVRAFLGAVRQVAPGAKPGFVVKTGTSDMNVVGPAWRCPILAYGPGDSSLDHTPHEHLPLDDYWQAVLVLEQALRNLVGD